MIRRIFLRLFGSFLKKEKEEEYRVEEEARKVNPFLPKFRRILAEILEQKQMNYRDFKPLLIDSDKPAESLLDEDDIAQALEQISPDLNFLTILTKRPEYFTTYIETMYEETGLAVLIQEKTEGKKYLANLVLDFEQEGPLCNNLTVAESIYLPIYKREWGMLDNLDICVPIGYNTVIVKGS